MKQQDEQKMEPTAHTKPDTWVVENDGSWYPEHGYLHPDDLIDHGADLDQPEALVGIFAAYNQHHIDKGSRWNVWPSWELCLTSMDIGLHFSMPNIDSHDDWVQREHWLALAQMLHDHPAISMNGYTITVQGSHGHSFAFDFCLSLEKWGAPGTFEAYKARAAAAAKKPKSWKWSPPPYLHAHGVAHSLGPYWDCPEHIPEIGGLSTVYTHDACFCIDHLEGSFPSNLMSLLLLCLEDYHIWEMQYEEALNMQAYVERMELEWPGGKPEDWEYQ